MTKNLVVEIDEPRIKKLNVYLANKGQTKKDFIIETIDRLKEPKASK